MEDGKTTRTNKNIQNYFYIIEIILLNYNIIIEYYHLLYLDFLYEFINVTINLHEIFKKKKKGGGEKIEGNQRVIIINRIFIPKTFLFGTHLE